MSIYAIPDPVHSYSPDPHDWGGPCRICGIVGEEAHGTAKVPSYDSTVAAVERLARSYAVQVVMGVRDEQLSNGFSTQQEDTCTSGELLSAATAYMDSTGTIWPFEADLIMLTPDDRIAEVARAASFLMAELERLLRADAYPPQPQQEV